MRKDACEYITGNNRTHKQCLKIDTLLPGFGSTILTSALWEFVLYFLRNLEKLTFITTFIFLMDHYLSSLSQQSDKYFLCLEPIFRIIK